MSDDAAKYALPNYHVEKVQPYCPKCGGAIPQPQNVPNPPTLEATSQWDVTCGCGVTVRVKFWRHEPVSLFGI